MSNQTKVNPWAHARPRYPVHTREFTLPEGQAFSLSLRVPDVILASKAGAVAEANAEAIRQEDGRLLFPGPDGEPIELTEDLIGGLAMIEVMQVGEERYTFPELVGFVARLPGVYRELAAWAREVAATPPELDSGNAPGAAATTP